MFVTDEGIPLTARERQRVVEEIFKHAALFGYQKEDIVVDGLVMAVSSNQNQAVETLNLIDWCSNSFGCNTILGLSNVSFGLPERAWLNAAFLAMAMGKGLSMAIANPLSQTVMNTKMAAEVLLGRDEYSQRYIRHFSQAYKERHSRHIKEQSDKQSLDNGLKGVKEGLKSNKLYDGYQRGNALTENNEDGIGEDGVKKCRDEIVKGKDGIEK